MFERFILGTDLSPVGAKQCLLVHCVSAKLGAALVLSYRAADFSVSLALEAWQEILQGKPVAPSC